MPTTIQALLTKGGTPIQVPHPLGIGCLSDTIPKKVQKTDPSKVKESPTDTHGTMFGCEILFEPEDINHKDINSITQSDLICGSVPLIDTLNFFWFLRSFFSRKLPKSNIQQIVVIPLLRKFVLLKWEKCFIHKCWILTLDTPDDPIQSSDKLSNFILMLHLLSFSLYDTYWHIRSVCHFGLIYFLLPSSPIINISEAIQAPNSILYSFFQISQLSSDFPPPSTSVELSDLHYLQSKWIVCFCFCSEFSIV